MLVECEVHIINKREGKKSKREVAENFPFLNMVYFLWTTKNSKCCLFFVDGLSNIEGQIIFRKFVKKYIVKIFIKNMSI